jgi:hypothetical protein
MHGPLVYVETSDLLAIALDDTRESEQCTALPTHYLFDAIPVRCDR